MNEDQARLFDALHKLMEQAWRDWDHKSRHEWRLSFGIWASLLLASGAVLNSTTQFNLVTPAICVSGVMILLHLGFNVWIQSRLREYRQEYLRLKSLLPIAVSSATPFNKKSLLKSPSLWTQLGVSIVLSIILLYVVESKASQPPTGRGETPERCLKH